MTRQIQHLKADQVYASLHSRADGLDTQEVAERRREVGPNTLEAKRKFWWLKSLIRQFLAFFTILLDIAAAISFVADYVQPGESMDILGWALLGVSVLNALFSFIQEYRAERAMEELRKFLPQYVLVRRDGADKEVPAEELVPGDVLVMREGDRVPADARIVECEGLLVNNAPLTGESAPILLSEKEAAPEAQFIDSENIIFAGCQVLRGVGLGVVFATAFRTEFGKIASLSHEVQRKISPLEQETAHMVRVLTIIAVGMGLVFFTYGLFTGRSLWVNLVFMMGIIVANVPEGLLPTFTLSLAMGSLRMARRNVLVKGLNAVETLGAVHVICTDKTGTLTLNDLAVTRLVDAVTGTDITDSALKKNFVGCALGASELRLAEEGFSGDPLDVAVAELLRTLGADVEASLERSIRQFPFDAAKRRAGGLIRRGNKVMFATKGAWESLRPLISHIEDPAAGEPVPINDEILAQLNASVHRLGSQGYRVIALAYRALKGEPDADVEEEMLAEKLVLKGFLGLEDPVRPEVPDAVAKCRRAGIQTIMITGDHPDTAAAIARRVGILEENAEAGQAVIRGDELAGFRKQELIDRLAAGASVFARTTPEQKMKIVLALHDLGKVVAVTGDGVNDAPALKAADVGVAMGQTGTDVAREAAQVILLDDNFASIVAGIEEGRTIFNNITKFTNYVLVSNGPEILPYILYMLFPVPLAMTVIQILSIDLGTDIVPSMGLGQEKPDKDIMDQVPREGRQGLLNWPVIIHSYFFLGLIEAAFALSLFFFVLLQGGWAYGEDLASQDSLYRSATGITLSAIIIMQIGNLFGRRSRYGLGIDRNAFKNPLITIGVLFEVIFSWAILYFPPLSKILGTGPVDLEIYAVAWLGMPLIFGLDYGRKIVARSFRNFSALSH